MNILIYTVNPQSPHMETDLELACKFRDRGDKVTVVRCTGQLRSCLVNPRHSPLICASCKSKYQKAIELIDLAGVSIISLPISNYSYEDVPTSFANIDELMNYKFRGADLGISVVSTLVGRVNKDHRFDTIKNKNEVLRELKMCIDIYLGLEKILLEVKPDEVYFFNGRFSSYHPLRSLCAKNNIAYYAHERGGGLNRYILRKNTIPHDIDANTTEINELWNRAGEDKERIGKGFFTERRKGVIESGMSYTESQKQGLLPPGFSQKKKNIVIFNSTIEEYVGMADWRNPIYQDENDSIRKILESFNGDKGYMFYLRVHPNLKLLRNTQMREIEDIASRAENLYLIRPEDVCDTYALMDHADKVLVFGSTMGSEATYWNKISISLGKSVYMNIDVCYQPTSHEEVVSLIKNDSLMPKDKINAIKYGYWENVKGEEYKKFKALDAYTMTCKGEVVEAPLVLRALEKIAKLGLIRNKRGVDTVWKKTKNLIGWK